MADLKKLAEELVNLTVKDVKELADILKEEYGIEPAAAAAVVAAAALDSPRTSFNSTTGFSASLSPNTAVNPLISTSSTAFIPFAKPNTTSISSIVIPASANALLTAFVRPVSEPVSVPNLTFE